MVKRNQREFKRQLFGYRRRAVDDHLAVVDASIADLRDALRRAAEPDRELILRATRLAVTDVMQQAHDEAGRIRTAAESEAKRLLADAYQLVAARPPVIDLRAEDDTAIDPDESGLIRDAAAVAED